jgi:hypothetical protein
MKTPKHLEGLVGVLTAVEDACSGTNHMWFLRRDKNGYHAQIFDDLGVGKSYIHHAASPTMALTEALMEFNLRTKGTKP